MHHLTRRQEAEQEGPPRDAELVVVLGNGARLRNEHDGVVLVAKPTAEVLQKREEQVSQVELGTRQGGHSLRARAAPGLGGLRSGCIGRSMAGLACRFPLSVERNLGPGHVPHPLNMNHGVSPHHLQVVDHHAGEQEGADSALEGHVEPALGQEVLQHHDQRHEGRKLIDECPDCRGRHAPRLFPVAHVQLDAGGRVPTLDDGHPGAENRVHFGKVRPPLERGRERLQRRDFPPAPLDNRHIPVCPRQR